MDKIGVGWTRRESRGSGGRVDRDGSGPKARINKNAIELKRDSFACSERSQNAKKKSTPAAG